MTFSILAASLAEQVRLIAPLGSKSSRFGPSLFLRKSGIRPIYATVYDMCHTTKPHQEACNNLHDDHEYDLYGYTGSIALVFQSCHPEQHFPIMFWLHIWMGTYAGIAHGHYAQPSVPFASFDMQGVP
jgi:hypothetical protein